MGEGILGQRRGRVIKEQGQRQLGGGFSVGGGVCRAGESNGGDGDNCNCTTIKKGKK